MSFYWSDFLEVAEYLDSHSDLCGPEEAVYRTATGRAYYAAFQCAFNVAKEDGYNPSWNAADHDNVREYFRENLSPEGKSISTELIRMKDNRRQVDYDLNLRSTPRSLAYQNITAAKKVIGILNRLGQK